MSATIPTATASKAQLRAIILDALSAQYTSHSGEEKIATGNRYQTVRLGQEDVPGFRSARSPLFDALDFKGATVLDLGSNLGETSRSALREGASRVVGLEYDHLFALVSKLINLHEGIDTKYIEFRQADITKDKVFGEAFDYTLALSVFRFMGARLKEISNSTRRALVVETHNLDSADRLNEYLDAISPHFETTAVIGYSDWGAGDKFSNGKRAYVIGFKSRRYFWDFVSRCQSIKPSLSSLLELDIATETPSVLSQLKKHGMPSDEKLLAIPRNQYLHEAIDLEYPSSASHAAYWMEFRRGYLDAKRQGHVDHGNPYVRLMQMLVSNGNLFDPGAMTSMMDPKILLERCSKRIANFDRADASPAVLFSRRGEVQPFELLTTSKDRLTCSNIDGFHRLACAWIRGQRSHPAYHFTVAGKL